MIPTKLALVVYGCILVMPQVFAQTKPPTSTDKSHLISVKKIWDAAPHNAFTDLIRFNDQWFCTFRESQAHVGGNGKIRVLTSSDGNVWKSAALISEDGIDLRDPKFSTTPDHRLMLTLGGSVYEGKTLKQRQSRVTFSADGRTWTQPRLVLQNNDWLWRVTWHKGHAYGISYNSARSTANKGDHNDWILKLVKSDDGKVFNPVTTLDVPGHPNESTIRFLDDDTAVALVRREGMSNATVTESAWIGTSRPPYEKWKWQPAGMAIGGPNFLIIDAKRMIAAGRQYGAAKKDAKTFVGRMTLDSVTPEIVLPSGGDCSYPGLVWHDGLLWTSYYSSHEGKTSIYLAKIDVPWLKP